jgi:hypothetical protein
MLKLSLLEWNPEDNKVDKHIFPKAFHYYSYRIAQLEGPERPQVTKV